MGSIGAAKNNTRNVPSVTTEVQNTTDTRTYRSRTNSVDSEQVMLNSYFKNAADLNATIAAAESRGFDILNNDNSGDYGTILYTWSYGNEGDAYEVYWERTYANPANPNEVQVRRFRHYEEGEW